ncbi:MAG: LacI family DNA-binding transcriptional regulator [Paracoccaceae bacterium]
MKPPYPLKEIAFQAGLSLATVDRALHDRPGTRKTTRARVMAAVAELERQYAAAALDGRRFGVDVVIEAPHRFTRAVRAAFEAELPGLRPARIAARFHTAETMETAAMLAILRAIRKRGSHGVILKAPARPEVAEAAAALGRVGIPVLTYVTDLPAACRLAYVGMDNRAAGASAAWLMGQMLADRPCAILLSLSSAAFAGEDEREAGFRAVLARHFPTLRAVTVAEGHGVDRATGDRVAAALADDPEIGAVYSIGGGNRAVLAAFDQAGRQCRAFAAHDLDEHNRALLAAGRISFVLHHDLRHDARMAGQLFLRHHRMLPESFQAAPSPFSVATPFAIPDM